MEFVYKNDSVSIESEKKIIALESLRLMVDGLVVEMAGEYEKSGFLVYAHEYAERRIYQMRIE
jgi:hypothetical protein